MHDKMNNEESVENIINNLNEYFNLNSIGIDDLSDLISECDKKNKEKEG